MPINCDVENSQAPIHVCFAQCVFYFRIKDSTVRALENLESAAEGVRLWVAYCEHIGVDEDFHGRFKVRPLSCSCLKQHVCVVRCGTCHAHWYANAAARRLISAEMPPARPAKRTPTMIPDGHLRLHTRPLGLCRIGLQFCPGTHFRCFTPSPLAESRREIKASFFYPLLFRFFYPFKFSTLHNPNQDNEGLVS